MEDGAKNTVAKEWLGRALLSMGEKRMMAIGLHWQLRADFGFGPGSEGKGVRRPTFSGTPAGEIAIDVRRRASDNRSLRRSRGQRSKTE
jgi:hypothetical protein